MDIGSNDIEKKGRNDTKKKAGSRTKITQYKYGSTTHVTGNSGACKFKKKNLCLTAAKGGEEKEGEKEGTDSNIIVACEI